MVGWQQLIDNLKLGVEALNKIASAIGKVVNLPNGSVTNEKLADVPTRTFKGRIASGSGPVSDIGLPAFGYDEYRTWSGLTAVIPLDNTIPQSTEGTEVLSVTLTPQSADSNLVISFGGQFQPSLSSLTYSIFSVFRDSGTNAEHAEYFGQSTTNGAMAFGQFSIPSGSTATTTIRLRVGPAGAYTIYLNGADSGQLLGGAQGWTLTVQEVL